MRLDRTWIERHIPHEGAMCLLEEVMSWDAARITCRGRDHRAADNPLRAGGWLGIACGIEYAAQAMAVHGALAAGALETAAPEAHGAAAVGLLVGLRGVEFRALRLDDVPGDLYCDAVRVAGDRATALYDFGLRASSGTLLVRGRATVLLEATHRMGS